MSSATEDGAAAATQAGAALRRQPTPAVRSLSRQPTLRERFEGAADEIHRRLEPMLEAADSAVNEMSILLDPGAIGEALTQQKPSEMATSASAKAVCAEAEAQQEAKMERLTGSLIDPHKIMATDKLAFLFGVANVCLTTFWVGRSPENYYVYWLVKDVVLFSLRFLIYQSKGMHYMMLEYCYAANAVSFYYLFFRPQSAALRRFCFAVMTGPLMWSIVAMRNSLVFHDGDKTTTLMMHASPALAAWCMRWYPRAEWTAGMTPAQLADFDSASWLQMAVVPAGLNLAWVAVYYLIIFVLFDKRIRSRGYQNMFTAMVTRPSARKSALAKVVLSVPPPLQPLFYLGIHTAMCWLSLLPTKIWFDSYWAHTAILLAVLGVAAWNGANFYFRVFAKKLMARQAEVQAAQAAAGAAPEGKKAA